MITANTYNESVLREKIIELSLLQLNKMYKHGSHGPNDFDCAGLVWYLYHEIFDIDIYSKGYGLSTTTMIMTSKYGDLLLFEEKEKNKDLSLIKNGDIVFFHRQSKKENLPTINNKYPGHCGIYMGDNNFIHCSVATDTVAINNLEKDIYWRKILVGSKDIISDEKVLKHIRR